MIKKTTAKLFFIVFFLFTLPVSSDAKDILIFTTVENHPLVKPAFSILREAYSNLDIKIKIQMLPAKRALIYSNKGKSDGELGRRKEMVSGKFKNLIIVDVPLFNTETVAITNKRGLKIYNWNCLKPFRIGVLRGVSIAQIKTVQKRVILNNPVQLIKMFEFNRIDVGLLTRSEAVINIKKLGMKNVRIVEPPLINTPVFHFLNKKNASLVPQLTRILKRMEREGKIKKIFSDFLNNTKVKN